MNMKIYALISFSFLLTLASCSSIESDCKKDWFQEGRNTLSQGQDPQQIIERQSVYCEKYFPSDAKANFYNGVEFEKVVQCTGFADFHTEGWKGLGHAVALRGDTKEFYKALKDKCQLSPKQNELTDYVESFKHGLSELCTKSGGVEFARKGLAYHSTCTGNEEKNFFTGIAIGTKFREIDSLRKKSDELQSKIDQLNTEIDQDYATIDYCKDKEHESQYRCLDSKYAKDKIIQSRSNIRAATTQKAALDRDVDRLYKELEITQR